MNPFHPQFFSRLAVSFLSLFPVRWAQALIRIGYLSWLAQIRWNWISELIEYLTPSEARTPCLSRACWLLARPLRHWWIFSNFGSERVVLGSSLSRFLSTPAWDRCGRQSEEFGLLECKTPEFPPPKSPSHTLRITPGATPAGSQLDIDNCAESEKYLA